MTKFGDSSDLLDFLTTGRTGGQVIFLLGSGLTKPSPGTSAGVPGVEGFIKLLREELKESPDALMKLDNEILPLEPPSRRYREAFDHLEYRRNYAVANKLVRLAVLQARVSPETSDDAVIEGAEEACAALERDLDGWILNPAVAALGEIIAQSPDHFGKIVLTTNLDPLIEVAIDRAGGLHYRTAVHSDSSFEDTRANGCRVVHLHGHWYGTDTLHTADQLNQPRPRLEGSLAQLLRKTEIAFVALGYGGWEDIFMSALCAVLEESQPYPDVRWAFLEDDESEIQQRYQHLFERLDPGIRRGRIRFYKGVDLQIFLPEVASRLQGYQPLRARDWEQEYRETVAHYYRIESLLQKRMYIDTNYYPLKLQRIAGDEDQPDIIDAVTLLRTRTWRRVCILGPSGSGKTTIIRRLLWESRDSDSPTPLVVSLRNHADTSLPEPIAVDSLLSCTFRSFQLHKNTLYQLSRVVANRKGLFIFDGFDELRSKPDQAYRIADAIETFFAGRPDCQVVITSRTQEDLHGKFTGFEWYNLMPINKTEIGAFSSKLGFKIRSLSTLTGQLEKVFDLRPVLLLMAMLLAQRGTSLNTMGSIRSQFQLLEIALAELLLERQKEAPRKSVRPFSRENVFDIRMSILERIVQAWGISSLPCRLSKAQLVEYVSEAIRGVMSEEGSVSEEEISFLVPTGICLKLITEIGRPEEYCFVHNSIQEFLYAKSILKSVRSRKSNLLAREYYSAEIMQLLGEELTASDVDVLLSWARSPDVDLMTKKVSLGILGFAKRNANLSRLARSELEETLARALDEEKDLGVAGRIAEALRRLGHPQTTDDIIDKLPDYPHRKESRSVKEEFNRPVTFEIDHPIEGISDDLALQLRDVHLRSDSPLVRKHALIYLMRRTGSLPVHIVVRHCFSEYNRLTQARAPSVAQSRNVAEILRSLRYGFAALKRYGTSVEKNFVQHTKEGLERIIGIDEQTMQFLNKTVIRVASADWLRDVPAAQEGSGSTVFLIRHGESNGNIEGRFLGRRLDGELTDKGRLQAEYTANCLGEIVSHPPIVVASTMGRALQTAAALESKLDWPIETEELFAEMDYGDWTGCLKGEIMTHDKDRYEAWRADPRKHPPSKGESFYEVRSRACSGFAKWYAEAVKNEVDLVIVSHLFPMSAIFEALTGDSLRDSHNCSITRIKRIENRWEVTALGLTDHLGESGLGSAFIG